MQNEAIFLWPAIMRNANLALRKFIHLGTKVNFARKEKVGGSLAPPGIFYLIHRGIIRLSYPAATGEDKVICFFGENTIFNEVPAATTVKLCTFTCMEDVEATAFDVNIMRSPEIISQYPEIALNMQDSCMQKYTMVYHQLTSLGAYTAFTNVCRLLYSICLHNRKGDKIIPYLSKQDFASILSIHRGSLHKCLVQLKAEGIIASYSKRSLEVIDINKLKRYALAHN